MFKRNSPGCPCCDDTEPICLIQSNDLDSDKDLTENFTLSDAEDFSYHEAPFDAIQVSDASETATANTPHPQSPYPPRVRIDFYGDQIGSQARVILGGKIVAQVTLGDGCSQLDILNQSDDSEICQTLWMPGIDRNEWHRLTACYDLDTGVVKATVHSLADGDETYDLSCEYSGDALDATAAFGTGAGHIDNAYFKNFYFWRLWYCGSDPYTEDCHILGDDWDYYYELPERKYCYHCDTSCVIVSTDFSELEDGDMPCDWEDDYYGTWGIVDGQATGEGEVCHKWDATGGSYNVSATFDLGTLATVGDSVTVSLTNGDGTVSLTVTKQAANYLLEWLPATISSSEVTDAPTAVTLHTGSGAVCATVTHGATSTTVSDNLEITQGEICVSITQPTLADHVDAGMTAFSITKSREMDPDCPLSPCGDAECPYCNDTQWPAELLVEISGLEACENGTPSCNDFNGGVYCGPSSYSSVYGCVAGFDQVLASTPCDDELFYQYSMGVLLTTSRVREVSFMGPIVAAQYWLKPGYSIVSGHVYLKVETEIKVCEPSPPSFRWFQLWLRDLTANPIVEGESLNCETMNEVELEWVGAYRLPTSYVLNPSQRFCGGGYDSSISWVDSTSVAKVTSI